MGGVGSGGKNRVPTKIRVLRGNPSKRPLPEREAQPESAVPEPPAHLDREAKAEWRRMAGELEKVGLMTVIDRAAFAGYCVTWSTWVAAMKRVRKEGACIDGGGGYPVQNPQLTAANNALKQMRAFLCEFGMTPASRSRVTVAPREQAPDAFESLLAGRKHA